jgi:ribosomal protein S18 acetylase RimI-like enzyme
MHITVRDCRSDDLNALQEIAYRTFDDTFAPLNSPSNMKSYLKNAFDHEKLRDELSDSNSLFYFLYIDGRLSGYLKLNEHKSQTEVFDPKSMEIERIYIVKELQGIGSGQILMDKAIEVACARGKSYIWLSVWEKNSKALRFYIKNGFYKMGEHFFTMGDDRQTDCLMRKDL